MNIDHLRCGIGGKNEQSVGARESTNSCLLYSKLDIDRTTLNLFNAWAVAFVSGIRGFVVAIQSSVNQRNTPKLYRLLPAIVEPCVAITSMSTSLQI